MVLSNNAIFSLSPDTNYLFHSLILYTDTSILSNFLIKD
ncbi:hypothetical protein HMPREF9626_0955 [Streptococcus parasanguinis F0405]|uniref:Uncharacterized protein n=1 Tax=Streptococcus parasanguinis F0405 TaxID=905067 RepID=E3CBF9_STRPA|nr:hypothetical protein HMPREF9626_0955 [Streptococcus parasanguinis F0405]